MRSGCFRSAQSAHASNAAISGILADAGAILGDGEDDAKADEDGEDGGSDGGFVSVAGAELVKGGLAEVKDLTKADAPPPIQIRVQGRTVVLRESQALTGAEWDKMIEILKMLRPEDG